MRRECSQELHTVLHSLAEPVIHSRPQNATTSGANTSKHNHPYTINTVVHSLINKPMPGELRPCNETMKN